MPKTTAQQTVRNFRGESVTPHGADCLHALERKLDQAVKEALASGLAPGLILGALTHEEWCLHRHIEGDG